MQSSRIIATIVSTMKLKQTYQFSVAIWETSNLCRISWNEKIYLQSSLANILHRWNLAFQRPPLDKFISNDLSVCGNLKGAHRLGEHSARCLFTCEQFFTHITMIDKFWWEMLDEVSRNRIITKRLQNKEFSLCCIFLIFSFHLQYCKYFGTSDNYIQFQASASYKSWLS